MKFKFLVEIGIDIAQSKFLRGCLGFLLISLGTGALGYFLASIFQTVKIFTH